MLFQFHKGTIKTYDDIYKDYQLKLFQFHKGTIKTSGHSLDRVRILISIP